MVAFLVLCINFSRKMGNKSLASLRKIWFTICNLFNKLFQISRRLLSIMALVGLAFLLTYLAYGKFVDKSMEIDAESILTSISGTVGTVMAIEFSLLLLVVERIVSKSSPRFLNYILRNNVFIVTTVYSIFVILFCLLPFQSTYINKPQIALSAFSVSLVLFVISLIEAMHLMNLKKSILTPEAKSIKRWIKKELRKIEESQAKEYANLKGKVFSIPDTFEDGLENRLLPIRDIIIRSISDNNIQEATDGIVAFTDVVLGYLHCRTNFLIQNDRFMYFVYSEYQNIASIALKTGYLHLRIHPILINSLGIISENALKIKIAQTGFSNVNQLIAHPVNGIKNLCMNNLKHHDSSAPSMACRALERIGIIALTTGCVDESASIAKDLSEISIAALTTDPPNLYFLSLKSNISMMKIVNEIALNRDILLSRKHSPDYAIKSTIDFAISNTISTLIRKSDIEFALINPLEPFMCELCRFRLSDYRYNLAFLVGNLLFSTSQPRLANDGLEYIEADIYFRIFNPTFIAIDDRYFLKSNEALDTLYVSQLAILSIFNKKLHLALFENEASVRSKINKKKAEKVFRDGLAILWSYFNKHTRNKYENNHTLDVIFSLIIISLADSDTDIDFLKNIKSWILEAYKDYCANEYTPQDTFFKYCRILNQSVKNSSRSRKNILTNIPKYVDDVSAIYSSGFGNRSLPFSDSSKSLFFGDEHSAQQWKILGSYTMPNEFFDKLNSIIWKD